jgi:hypothetical protein
MRKIIILILFLSYNGFCQFKIGKKPVGKFLADTIKIGEVVNFSLVFKHDSKQEVFFPDKAYNYQPFELVDKIYFPTNTKNGISVDSALYQLRTFSVDSIQSISLPIFVYNKSDSLSIFCEQDSVLRIQEINGAANQLNLKESSRLLPMKTKINMVYLFLQISLIIIVSIIWWIIFGKTVMAQIGVFGLYRKHLEFKNAFNRLAKTTNKVNLENTLTLWKKYMSRLQKKSFNTMTTPEILENIPDENLADALHEIDKSIYGNAISDKISQAFDTLNELADNYYTIRKKDFSLAKKTQ